MANQQSLPESNGFGETSQSSKGQSKAVCIATTLVSISSVVGCVLIDWHRNQVNTASLPDSSPLTLYKVSYALMNLLVPLLVAGIVSFFSQRNRGRRFLFSFCGVTVALLVLRLPLLTMPATGVLHPVVHIAGAKPVHNENPTFDIEIPQGFEAYTNPKDPPSVLYTFIASSEFDEAKTAIGITVLEGLLPPNNEANRQRLQASMPAEVELRTKDWRGLSIDTFVSRKEVRGIEIVVYRVRVPLRPKAIELAVFGPASHDEELNKLADSLLASLDGQTNWKVSR